LLENFRGDKLILGTMAQVPSGYAHGVMAVA